MHIFIDKINRTDLVVSVSLGARRRRRRFHGEIPISILPSFRFFFGGDPRSLSRITFFVVITKVIMLWRYYKSNIYFTSYED
jgi:hypothetical protein